MNRADLHARAERGLHTVADRLPVLLPLLVAYELAGARLHSGDSDRQAGASIVETVLITAVLVTVVLAITAVIYNKLTAKANSIDFSTP